MRCPKCKSTIDDDTRICPVCGEKQFKMLPRIPGKPGKKAFHEKLFDSIKMIFDSFLSFFNRLHIVKFIRYQYEERHIGILIYTTYLIIPFLAFGILGIIFAIILGIHLVMYGTVFPIAVSYYEETFGMIGFGIMCLLCALAFLLLRNHQLTSGQKSLRKILGAYEIEREEHIDCYKVPIERIIEKARSEGMKLPETINIYLFDSDNPHVYAIGMNTIIISSGTAGIRDDIFEAMVRTELYKIEHMFPDYMTLAYGGSFAVLAISFVILLFTGITMQHGDRRKGFFGISKSEEAAYYHYLTIALALIGIGLVYLLFRKTVKQDILKADQYVASCGCGEAQCMCIDEIRDQDFRDELLQMGFPSPDERIAALQAAGVNYYESVV